MLIFSQTYPLSTTCQFTQFSVIRVFKMSNLTSSTAHPSSEEAHPSSEETDTYENTVAPPSRSDILKTIPPTHISRIDGKGSLEVAHQVVCFCRCNAQICVGVVEHH